MRFALLQHMPCRLRAKTSSLQGSAALWLLVLLSIAQPAFAADDAFDRVLKAFDLKTDVGQAPDFVQASRPKTEGDFLPVGATHPTRAIKVKSAAELKAMEADLDAARMQHDKIAGRKPPADAPAKKPPPVKAPAATQN